MYVCKNCQHCNVVTDEEFCKKLKCTATKRGHTLTWSMCCITNTGEPINVFQHFAEYLEKHQVPPWCPMNKAELKEEGIL